MQTKPSRFLRDICILIIRGYQITLGAVMPPCCRFSPSCSEYALQAFKRYGFLKGSLKTLYRLVRCNPYHPGGYDPVR